MLKKIEKAREQEGKGVKKENDKVKYKKDL